MAIADLIHSDVRILPEPLAREVLEFVVTLRESREQSEWRELMQAQTTCLESVWDNAEDNVRDAAS